MKVKELIERLKQCGEELEVCVCWANDDVLADTNEIKDLLQITHSSVKTNNGVVMRIQ